MASASAAGSGLAIGADGFVTTEAPKFPWGQYQQRTSVGTGRRTLVVARYVDIGTGDAKVVVAEHLNVGTGDVKKAIVFESVTVGTGRIGTLYCLTSTNTTVGVGDIGEQQMLSEAELVKMALEEVR